MINSYTETKINRLGSFTKLVFLVQISSYLQNKSHRMSGKKFVGWRGERCYSVGSAAWSARGAMNLQHPLLTLRRLPVQPRHHHHLPQHLQQVYLRSITTNHLLARTNLFSHLDRYGSDNFSDNTPLTCSAPELSSGKRTCVLNHFEFRQHWIK